MMCVSINWSRHRVGAVWPAWFINSTRFIGWIYTIQILYIVSQRQIKESRWSRSWSVRCVHCTVHHTIPYTVPVPVPLRNSAAKCGSFICELEYPVDVDKPCEERRTVVSVEYLYIPPFFGPNYLEMVWLNCAHIGQITDTHQGTVHDLDLSWLMDSWSAWSLWSNSCCPVGTV